jgi:hypothetical protein
MHTKFWMMKPNENSTTSSDWSRPTPRSMKTCKSNAGKRKQKNKLNTSNSRLLKQNKNSKVLIQKNSSRKPRSSFHKLSEKQKILILIKPTKRSKMQPQKQVAFLNSSQKNSNSTMVNLRKMEGVGKSHRVVTIQTNLSISPPLILRTKRNWLKLCFFSLEV